jgi:hypothetical protein
VINALAVLGATYGILFALVISEKASLTFSSWAFIIWSGWVLAIIMRICHCAAVLLGDYHSWERKKKDKGLNGITKFVKHSTYLLVPTASFVPIFAILETVSLEEVLTKYPWGQDASLFLGAFSLASVAVFYYIFVLAFGNLTNLEYADVYMYSVALLWTLGIFSISLSPLAPTTNRVAGFFLFENTVPSIIALIEHILFIMIGLAVGFFPLLACWR